MQWADISLAIEKALIDDHALPVRFYNYSYIQDQIRNNYQEKVSLPTIIDRAKKGFYIAKPERTIHDHEVITRHAGELIQHDSSYHRWSPYIADKLYLITNIDDYSRYLFYKDKTYEEGRPKRLLGEVRV
jgi:hypothetical protein